MNSLTTTKAQLPAHLQHLAGHSSLMAMNQAASAGIAAGGWPRISIKGSRWRLQSPQGEEVVVPSLDLDVVLVSANPHGLSKVFYAGAYDPSVDEKAPDCFSDNGVGPSSKAAKPQCPTCAACPNNVWGSKINPSGTQGKLCADVKKVAVMIAANPDGPIFELRIPPASLKNFAEYVSSLDKRGMPACTVITKLKFDPNSDFPKITFEASGWATAEQVQIVTEVIDTEEVTQCTGANDKPWAPSATTPPVQPAAPAPVPTAPIQPVNIPTGPVPQPNPAFPQHVPPVPVNGIPSVQPVPPTHTVPAENPVASPNMPLPQAIPPMQVPPAVAPKIRVRKTAAPAQQDFSAFPTPLAQPAAPPMAMPPIAPANPPIQPSAAASVAPLTAPVTNAALDDMIAGIMNV